MRRAPTRAVRVQNFVFEKDPGSGITIYMVDSGINSAPPDLAGRVATPIFGRDAIGGSQDDSDNGHSTYCASKAGGSRYGVAKAATLIPVETEQNFTGISTVFDQVRVDIIKRKLKGKAVVSFSWGTAPAPNAAVPKQWVRAAGQMKRIMLELDVPIVNSAGNDASRSKTIDKYPKVWSTDDWPLIVVGSVNFDGVESSFSQNGPKLALAAVGEGITRSNPKGYDSRITKGTSFAAPQVAGLLAYFLGMETVPFDTTHGKLALNAPNYLKNTASWARSDVAGSPRVAWNLITENDNEPLPPA